MTDKEIKSTDTQTLLYEYKKYCRKEKDVEQQAQAIANYLQIIDYELIQRFHNGEKIKEDWKEWRLQEIKESN